MEFKDRVANKPNRVKLTYEDSGVSAYAKVELADEPIESGTPLNKKTFDEMQKELKSYAHDVGNVLITSTNENPSKKLGGTWVLIDKEFRSSAEVFEDVFAPQFVLDGWSDSQYKLSGALATINDDEDYSNGLYKTNITVIRADHTVRLRIEMYPQTGDGSEVEVSFSDAGRSNVLKINFSKLGFKGFPTGFLDVLATSDTIGQAIMFSLNYTSYSNGKEVGATLYQSDVIGNSKSVVITESMSVEPITLDITSPVLCESMLDGYCDKFYWKRTA